jgi:hypothetical protein
MEKMGREEYLMDTEVDEYLWPLNGDTYSIHWEDITDELHIRRRLAEILAHVREAYIQPRLRRLGASANSATNRSIPESIIAGPGDGPPWAQTLNEPVPRELREEWNELARRLQELDGVQRQRLRTEA